MGTAPSLPETRPQLTIEEVLEVHLLCFEAGPDTNTLFAHAYAQPFGAHEKASTSTSAGTRMIWTSHLRTRLTSSFRRQSCLRV